jgi:hypothetical protein
MSPTRHPTSASPADGDAATRSAAGTASSSGRRTLALWMVTLLTLGSVVVLGHTQWWVPREQARQKAQVTYEHCLDEVQVYAGKHSYHDRLAQCGNLLRG